MPFPAAVASERPQKGRALLLLLLLLTTSTLALTSSLSLTGFTAAALEVAWPRNGESQNGLAAERGLIPRLLLLPLPRPRFSLKILIVKFLDATLMKCSLLHPL